MRRGIILTACINCYKSDVLSPEEGGCDCDPSNQLADDKVRSQDAAESTAQGREQRPRRQRKLS